MAKRLLSGLGLTEELKDLVQPKPSSVPSEPPTAVRAEPTNDGGEVADLQLTRGRLTTSASAPVPTPGQLSSGSERSARRRERALKEIVLDMRDPATDSPLGRMTIQVIRPLHEQLVRVADLLDLPIYSLTNRILQDFIDRHRDQIRTERERQMRAEEW